MVDEFFLTERTELGVKLEEKVVDDRNLTAFIIRYRLCMVIRV
jgi:hypothetical protein